MKLKLIIPCIAAALAMSSATMASEPKIDAVELWGKHCLSCHGKDGKGKTKAGIKAKVKDLTDEKHQESFTDVKAFKSISFGMKDKNGKEQMKPFESKLTDEEVRALVVYLRKFVKK
jgi:mono/diheme cytochrome c family protein